MWVRDGDAQAGAGAGALVDSVGQFRAGGWLLLLTGKIVALVLLEEVLAGLVSASLHV